MEAQEKLNTIVSELTNLVLNGVTYKNIRRNLENKKTPSNLIDKLIRLTELRIILKGC